MQHVYLLFTQDSGHCSHKDKPTHHVPLSGGGGGGEHSAHGGDSQVMTAETGFSLL